MNGKKFILLKQQHWARRKGIDLVPGTIGSNGEKAYACRLEANLFGSLSPNAKAEFAQGSGHETRGIRNQLPHMQALGSSSALAVNLFQYWQGRDIRPLLSALRLPFPKHSTAGDCTLSFEQKNPIGSRLGTPHIDVAIRESTCFTYAFEVKFIEPYRDKPKKLAAAYLKDESLWHKLPGLHQLAKELAGGSRKFQHLDAAQLVKHALGLRKQAGRSFCLTYLWYDALGESGNKHREEIKQFAQIAKQDGIRFGHITCQEAIANIAKYFYQGNEAYCDYLIERYL